MACVVIHGVMHAAPADDILLRAWLSLWGFAMLGVLVGSIAERAVRESVEQRLRGELAARLGRSEPAAVPADNKA